ncbi:migration and invasion inhibitory protein isoform X2 [Sphaeramia orbicularis]|uniref:migration and invasion inhibitory protein isoform X2 n=1 Tax=Sphaeramia orbicularis TaxID=375764 RepID=UPI00117DC059|nr:migration and invasion-inhibitory protein isoform X2 [Sphaeramia orbicularis]
MSSDDRLDVLRERNKDLLIQLRQQQEKLEHLCGSGQSRKREREDDEEEGRQSAEMRTLTDGDRDPARAALCKTKVKFTDTCERLKSIRQSISTPSLASDHRGGSLERTAASDIFRDRNPSVHESLQSIRPPNAKFCLVNHSETQEVEDNDTLEGDECAEIPSSDRHHLQPLLGYDWIAGVLDAEDSLIDRSDEFFNELHTFRSLHKDECVRSPQAEFCEASLSVLPSLSDKSNPDANKDTHQCTFSYRINSRLFPVPLNSKECCPVCKRHKSTHPHTTAEPALIRVSIPRSTLLPPYKYKAHRRCSFDPSDSLGLPSHCLSGWSNTGQSLLTPQSSLDLRSNLNIKHSTESPNKELEDLSAPKGSSRLKPDQIPHVSLLARHHFQHLSPKRKTGTTSHPVT